MVYGKLLPKTVEPEVADRLNIQSGLASTPVDADMFARAVEFGETSVTTKIPGVLPEELGNTTLEKLPDWPEIVPVPVSVTDW